MDITLKPALLKLLFFEDTFLLSYFSFFLLYFFLYYCFYFYFSISFLNFWSISRTSERQGTYGYVMSIIPLASLSQGVRRTWFLLCVLTARQRYQKRSSDLPTRCRYTAVLSHFSYLIFIAIL
jgi:hypothetical protein